MNHNNGNGFKKKAILLLLTVSSVLMLCITSSISTAYAQVSALSSIHPFYTYKENIATIISSQQSTSNKNFQIIRSGAIGSLQNGPSGDPEWILTGKWNITNSTNSPIFSALFTMVKMDGTVKHKHKVSSFKLTSGNPLSTSVNGTATISNEEQEFTNIPIGVKIMNDGAMILWIDHSKIGDHFGSTPIYGTSTRAFVDVQPK
jgi:ribosomal protein L31